jgi:hypothetical protein
VIDFDPTELTNFTVSDGLSATASTTYNLSGSNDPKLTAKNAGFVIESSGIPVFQMDDTDQAAGSSPDWASFINCTSGPACQYSMTHQITGGVSSNILVAASDGTTSLGDATSPQVRIFTDGTGDDVLLVPDNSIGTTELTETGVSGTSCTNCNLTYGVDGRLTAASSGTNIPAGFALYVDKAGTDSAACGPLSAVPHDQWRVRDHPDVMTTALHFGNNARGCGRCSTTTSTVCNETSDRRRDVPRRRCLFGLGLGTCTGPFKATTCMWRRRLLRASRDLPGSSNAGSSAQATCAMRR